MGILIISDSTTPLEDGMRSSRPFQGTLPLPVDWASRIHCGTQSTEDRSLVIPTETPPASLHYRTATSNLVFSAPSMYGDRGGGMHMTSAGLLTQAGEAAYASYSPQRENKSPSSEQVVAVLAHLPGGGSKSEMESGPCFPEYAA